MPRQFTALHQTNQLVRFGATSPGNVTTVGPITGLQSGENVLGIHFRPETGQLYALGSNSRIYQINKLPVQRVLSPPFTTPLTEQISDLISIRLLTASASSAIQDKICASIRKTERTVDGTLTYSAGDANSGANPTITGAAYTGSFIGTTATALYDIDSGLTFSLLKIRQTAECCKRSDLWA